MAGKAPLFIGAIMPAGLRTSLGHHSDKGRKPVNQDFHGALIPDEPLLSRKGIAIAISDGVSSSEVSHIASESAVKGFLTEYYRTSLSWSVKTSAQRVFAAANARLHSQTRRSQHACDREKGYVCTLSAMVLKSTRAHIFHAGDCRIYRIVGNTLEQLTDDHRVAVSSTRSYLARALGINPRIEIDYRAIAVEKGDVFLLVTDGVYEYVNPRFVARTIADNSADLDKAARIIVDKALQNGSADNLTIQIVRIDDLPQRDASDIFRSSIGRNPNLFWKLAIAILVCIGIGLLSSRMGIGH